MFQNNFLHFQEEWYRFEGEAGTQLADERSRPGWEVTSSYQDFFWNFLILLGVSRHSVLLQDLLLGRITGVRHQQSGLAGRRTSNFGWGHRQQVIKINNVLNSFVRPTPFWSTSHLKEMHCERSPETPLFNFKSILLTSNVKITRTLCVTEISGHCGYSQIGQVNKFSSRG